MAFCGNCGNKLPEGAYACPQCGRVIGVQPTPVVPEPAQYQPRTQPAEKSIESKAVASLVCGIIGLVIFGLILGIIAIVQSRSYKAAGGTSPMATAGFILGIIDIVATFIILFINLSALY